MTCVECGHDYGAANQHSKCPKCGTLVGTKEEREDSETHAEMVEAFEEWASTTADSRDLAEKDRDYKNGKQWSDADANEVRKRGQAPIVVNLTAKKIDFLVGMEIRNRVDPKAVPRTISHDQDAEAITDAIRSVCDQQDFDNVASIGWEQMLIEGTEAAIVEHKVVNDNEIEICLRAVAWDRTWHDPHSRRADFDDAKHKGVSTWFDLDDAIHEYSQRDDATEDFEEMLRGAVGSQNSGSDEHHPDRPLWASGEKRKRVRVVECYYIKQGKWWVCHYTSAGFIVKPKPTGYVDEHGNDVCPLVMASAFVDREGMRFGMVRNMIGPQDEVNKRRSKALHLLSVRQIWAEEGALPDIPSAKMNAAKPDGVVIVRPDALTDGSIKIEQTGDMAQGQFMMLENAERAINSIGPEIPQIGSGPATSGRELMIRQQIGSLELARIEDNHKRWKRELYRQIWYRIRQFWPGEKWVRVRDDAEKLGFRFVGLNRKMTYGQRFMEMIDAGQPLETAAESALGPAGRVVVEQVQRKHAMAMQQNPQAGQIPPEQHQQMITELMQQHPVMSKEFIAAHVAELDVDIVLDESPDTATIQSEESEKLAQLMPVFLQAQQSPWTKQLLEMMIEATMLRNKRKLLEMLRRPPDKEAQQMQKMMQQIQQAGAQAKLQKTQSETQLNAAKAAHEQVDTQLAPGLAQAESLQSQGQAMVHAANTGEKMSGAPDA